MVNRADRYSPTGISKIALGNGQGLVREEVRSPEGAV